MLKKIIYKLFVLLYRLFEGNPYKAKSFGLSIERIKTLEKRYQTRLTKAGILASKERRAMFWAQLAHESGLKPIPENLNYSASGLLAVFPKYFNPLLALQYARKPQLIANRVYANRMGNGDELSGDGWRYRGRGFIQTTGRDNYKALSCVGVDALAQPDLLLAEGPAMVAAIYFWERNDLNKWADLEDIRKVTRRINGGLNGLADREKKYNTLIKEL